jgi:hypothetical protein
MTAEIFGQGLNNNAYYDNGFDSVINFSFPKTDSLGNLEKLYSDYANKINSTESFNVLSYISSHDTGLTRVNMINYGTKLLLSPGGVEIYYGDETDRRATTNTTTTAKDQPSRSDMNWDSIDSEVLSHWQKIGKFRSNHISIGAGEHKLIQSSPYAFSRVYEKNNIKDKTIIVVDAKNEFTLDVSSVFEGGTKLQNFYTETNLTVINGSISITPGNNGLVLLEKVK